MAAACALSPSGVAFPPQLLTERNAGMVRLPWTSHRARSKQQTRFRPRLEVLEGRIAPATRVWDGGGANNQWATAANWVGDVAPATGDDLVFPGGAQQATSVNNSSAT